jgi:hypothetical protein
MRIAIRTSGLEPGVVCEAPASDGTMTVPTTILSGLPAGTTADLAATTYNATSVAAGAYEVILSSGSAIARDATLE